VVTKLDELIQIAIDNSFDAGDLGVGQRGIGGANAGPVLVPQFEHGGFVLKPDDDDDKTKTPYPGIFGGAPLVPPPDQEWENSTDVHSWGNELDYNPDSIPATRENVMGVLGNLFSFPFGLIPQIAFSRKDKVGLGPYPSWVPNLNPFNLFSGPDSPPAASTSPTAAKVGPTAPAPNRPQVVDVKLQRGGLLARMRQKYPDMFRPSAEKGRGTVGSVGPTAPVTVETLVPPGNWDAGGGDDPGGWDERAEGDRPEDDPTADDYASFKYGGLVSKLPDTDNSANPGWGGPSGNWSFHQGGFVGDFGGLDTSVLGSTPIDLKGHYNQRDEWGTFSSTGKTGNTERFEGWDGGNGPGKAYLDTSKKLTIGLGFNMDKDGAERIMREAGILTKDKTWAKLRSGKIALTKEEGRKLKAYEHEYFVKSARTFIGPDKWRIMTSDGQDALYDMAYNMGGSGLKAWTNLRKALRSDEITAKLKLAGMARAGVEKETALTAVDSQHSGDRVGIIKAMEDSDWWNQVQEDRRDRVTHSLRTAFPEGPVDTTFKAIASRDPASPDDSTNLEVFQDPASPGDAPQRFQQGGLVPSPTAIGQAPQAGLNEFINYTPRATKDQNMNFPWLPQYQQGGLIPGPAAVGQAPPGVGQAGQTAAPVSPQEIEAEIQRIMQDSPQQVLQIKQAIQEQLQTGQLTQQELNLAGQLAQAAAQNPQLWPKLRAFAIQQGLADENDLSQEFDAGLVVTLLMAVRAIQSDIGSPGQPQAAGQPGVPQQGQVAPPQPAGLTVPDASGQPPRGVFGHGGETGKSRNVDGSIPAILHEKEFVIPANIVTEKGTDFFNKMIDPDFGKSKGS